jgi:hypothetical protein
MPLDSPLLPKLLAVSMSMQSRLSRDAPTTKLRLSDDAMELQTGLDLYIAIIVTVILLIPLVRR